MVWLGIESSCDETALALIRMTNGKIQIVDDQCISQALLHKPFGGIVPEFAVREHSKNLPMLMQGMIKRGSLCLEDVEAIAVTEGPGLMASLLVGNAFARGLAQGLGIPVYGMNHLEGHLFSPFIGREEKLRFPFLGLVVSGGHTILTKVDGPRKYEMIGSTIDDAAGEAFDKVGRLLGLDYPGGPEIEKWAKPGNANAYAFPLSLIEKNNYNFSFSGLKTAVRYFVEKRKEELLEKGQFFFDVCASFQEAIARVIQEKTISAAKAFGLCCIAASGGVLANQRIRTLLKQKALESDIEILIADKKFCTDNAVMIAFVAALFYLLGLPITKSREVNPNLSLIDFNRELKVKSF
ncbi:tRNA N6-adenosine(37)-threonylcarbamoyltransferase complex transferase subunit TsaD [Methylacidiphilum sp. Yel]|jgi:N6-L-threonylcarbamoyladenine synthase|uniref:tRNA (adenosine(37)-N6)-threonylcarbamoyltransferase complex transferase subunit TsaD n=1 Tax=Methylacidiphilum sp. Yel TaxID=1847730 RepID=UPI00106C0D15|nr:tRNA (adenosine(37)-N6)-threonylcarbamoyltransferase complex transferase subunit TsaD [Methylacidiphilum sp. Yel]TFE69224.1 tRNA N6-adenosine(37)-threonylcarbamoyltransferase complex transferase subunit TsaD [Methylacidiphilum sp. Yel]